MNGTESIGKRSETEVSSMFDRIARRYDRMNAVMTLGLHERWRKEAADLAEVKLGASVLDVATGTGDLAFELGKRVGGAGKVLGIDPSSEMLAVAKEKGASLAANNVIFVSGSAMKLPYEENRFDAVTVAFGARNFDRLDVGIREMVRVLKPGGKLVILEIAKPTKGVVAQAYSVWFDRLVPFFGRFMDREGAYSYLPASVQRFETPDQIAEIMRHEGLGDVAWSTRASGMLTFHHGRKG